jgi:hypothetical protein
MTGQIGHPLLDAAPVHRLIGAHDLDVDRPHSGACRSIAPGGARQRERIHGISHDFEAKPQVVLGDRISHPVPRIVDRAPKHTGAANRLLDGVDSHVDGGQAAGQCSGDRRLPCARQAGKDDELSHMRR